MQDIVFERILLPIVIENVYKDKEAKASEATTYVVAENERKYYILPFIPFKN